MLELTTVTLYFIYGYVRCIAIRKAIVLTKSSCHAADKRPLPVLFVGEYIKTIGLLKQYKRQDYK